MSFTFKCLKLIFLNLFYIIKGGKGLWAHWNALELVDCFENIFELHAYIEGENLLKMDFRICEMNLNDAENENEKVKNALKDYKKKTDWMSFKSKANKFLF